jgi:hypothetical protein
MAAWAYSWAPGMDLYRPVQYAISDVRPFAILMAALAIADIGQKGLSDGRAWTLFVSASGSFCLVLF